MTYIQKQIADLERAFPDVPLLALKAAFISGIETFSWWKDGVKLCGTTGTRTKDAIAEVMAWRA